MLCKPDRTIAYSIWWTKSSIVEGRTSQNSTKHLDPGCLAAILISVGSGGSNPSPSSRRRTMRLAWLVICLYCYPLRL